MVKHGGKRPGAGRPKGVQNKATAEQKATLSELARTHADVALAALVDVASGGQSDAARVAAACALLDRAFGRPGQLSAPVAPEPTDSFADLLGDIRAQGSRAPIATKDYCE